ncbi:hypothetical protein JQC67_12905 [Aurantibacter crassamenti]|uniref:hypothetical protein n=1 Tax=Aurantibacter crassamenti TaxID=1837375 RepID=UPI00193A5A14|nr:hypothetical protein [Aurantibacter crassamenti]MBM1107044.1 hypothetical protein [Aurantibacter crassamenti]
MAFGAGHVQDMNNRLKQNRAQRPSKRAKFKENNREGIYSTEKKPEKPNFKTVPEKELSKFRKLIRETTKAERKRERIIYGVLILFAMISFIGILLWLN